jgi:hypothetical protein
MTNWFKLASDEDDFIGEMESNSPSPDLIANLKILDGSRIQKVHKWLNDKIIKEGWNAPKWIWDIIDFHMCVNGRPPYWAFNFVLEQSKIGKFKDSLWGECAEVKSVLPSAIKGDTEMGVYSYVSAYLKYHMTKKDSYYESVPQWILNGIDKEIMDKRRGPTGKVSPFSGFLDSNVSKWIFSVLSSGVDVPDKWINFIEEANSLNIMPTWARSWALNRLYSGDFPKEWKEKLIDNITHLLPGECSSHWAESWLSSEIASGKADKRLYQWIVFHLKKDLTANKWSSAWIVDQLNSESPPDWVDSLVPLITSKIRHDDVLPFFLEKWVKDKFINNEAYPEWINALTGLIYENISGGRITDYYIKIISHLMIKNKCPDIWYDWADVLIIKKAIPAKWAEDWAKAKIKDGKIPEKWMASIEKFVEENKTSGLNRWCFEALQKMTVRGYIPESIIINDQDGWIMDGISQSGKVLFYASKYPNLKKSLHVIHARWLEIIKKPLSKESADMWANVIVNE